MNKVCYCQSCGMPMEDSHLYGTNSDGSKNKDYCVYCYTDGNFIADCSMEEMIDYCVPHMIKNNKNMSEDGARKIMNEFFPTLKRWKK
ncbi:transcriptional regulator [Vallitalea longa]|uniref:Transcriptional regulator n=1 Tax=Vallitalea longa TaxID=2936439 RepID=A0A9W5Y729_9FIRM|nr:zinc ribbon domain-containing protein [Vallitalea longa]GKX27622.1 transcriptional regulator [Vallitalea longa]